MEENSGPTRPPCKQLRIVGSWGRVEQPPYVSECTLPLEFESHGGVQLPLERPAPLFVTKLPSEITLTLGEIAATNGLPFSKCLGSPESSSLQLLHYFIQVFAKSCIPLCSRAQHAWFIQAATDPAVYHGMLLVATAHHALTKGSILPPECNYHKAEATRLINDRLKSSKARTDEAVVAGIACLVAYDSITDPTLNGVRHLQGLERVMKLQHENYRDELAEYLRHLVYWSDLSHSTANLDQPRFRTHSPLPQYSTIEEEELLHSTLNRRWGPEFPESPVRQYDGMDIPMAKLFFRLRQLSTLATSMDSSTVDSPLQQIFTDRMMLFERQVNASIWSMALNNIRIYGSANRPKASVAVRACARTWHCTVLIYLYFVLRKMPAGSLILQNLVTRFKISLLKLSPEEMWSHFPSHLLLWMLFIAGIASVADVERRWFSGLVHRLRAPLQLETWEDVKKILVEYAWVEGFCCGLCRNFWQESMPSGPQERAI